MGGCIHCFLVLLSVSIILIDQLSQLDFSTNDQYHLLNLFHFDRLGELVIPRKNLFDPLKHVSRNILPINFRTLQNEIEYANFHIPWTKTTLQEGADILITARDHYMCPIEALRHHTKSNTNIPLTSPLFSFETSEGDWAPMTKTWFLTRCNTIWVNAGYLNMPGHTFRIGGATELLLQGMNPDIVATQGRWRSQAFLEYWHKIESILPLFISNSDKSARALQLDTTMDAFKSRHKLKNPSNSS